MKIAIICAMSSERAIFCSRMTERKDFEINGLPYSEGKLSGRDVVVCVSGIGKVNAAITAQTVIDRFSPDVVINSGIAGSLSEKAPHLSIVVSDKLSYHDFDLSIFDNDYPYVSEFSADRSLIEKYFAANFEMKDLVFGNVATGDQFVTSSAKKAEIKAKTNALACEMEGAAIAHAAYVNKVPFIVLRCISDLADDNAEMTFDEFEQIAADKVAKTVISLIASI